MLISSRKECECNQSGSKSESREHESVTQLLPSSWILVDVTFVESKNSSYLTL